jgi:protein-S-isoprenylcysteine O-methyltransferase Ste14
VSKPDTPGVRIMPPLLFAGSFLVGVLIQQVLPIPWTRGDVTPVRIAGGVALVFGIVLAAAARNRFVRAGTNVNPMLPVTTLVTHGPFRVTRNPMYLGLSFFTLGLALLINMVWPALLLVPTIAVLQREVIAREERLLEAKFGDEYRAYRKRVRRWF